VFVQVARQFQAGHARHRDVEHGQARLARFNLTDRPRRRSSSDGVVTGVAQHFFEKLQQQRVVVDDKDQALGGGR
jgi:hypothetical protein